MGSGKPIPARKRAAILEEIRKGNKLAQIARRHNVSPSAVKAIRIAEGLQPLPTDDAKANAAQARAVNMLETKRRRDVMEMKLIETAERLHGQLFAPSKVYAFGGKEYGYVEEEIDEPDFKAKQAIMISIGIALDKAMQLNKYNAEGSAAASAAIIELVDFLKVEDEEKSD